MKSKKLFAILTLVAFMMTLLPAFAFADDVEYADYSASATTVKVNDKTIDVYDMEESDIDDMAKFTITFKKTSTEIIKNNEEVEEGEEEVVKFYLKTEDYDALVGFVTNDKDVESWEKDEVPDGLEIDGKTASSEAGQEFTIAPNGDGQVFVYLSGTIPDTVDVDFYDGPAEADTGSGKGRLIDSIEIKIQVGKGGKLTLAVQGGKGKEEIGEDITLVATVVDNVGDPLEDVTVVFQKQYEKGSWVTIGQVETDDDGKAELDVEETRAGSYEYKAYLSTDKNKVNDTIKFNWEVAKIAKIVAKTADGTKIAVDEKYDLEFYLYDASGYLIKGNDELAVDFIVVDQPKDGDIDDDDNIKDKDDGKSDGIVKISITPAEVGTYEFKLRSAKKSTVYDTVTIKVQEYGTTEDMEISLADDKPSVTYGADESDKDKLTEDGVLDVKLIDEEGVKKQADPSNLSFGSSSRDVVEVDQEGKIIVVDEDFIGEVTITVIDEESGISKDFALNVVGQPVSMNPVVTVNGLKASVEMQYVDKNGTRTYSGDDDVLKVVVPAKVTSSNIENFDPDSGIATFDLAADEAGEYTIVATSDIGISKSFKVAFEGATSSAGAKKVIMFIGRTEYVQDGEIKTADVAPFIRDNRTFVAVRPIADAFGVTPENIGWDETTKTVTLTRDDITVTIVIGSSDISVVKDGVTSTVTADVPAFIQDGRTVLPFRAVGEAFGAEVDYDQATQSVTYTQK